MMKPLLLGVFFLLFVIEWSLGKEFIKNCMTGADVLKVGACLANNHPHGTFSACLEKSGELCVSSNQTQTWCTNSKYPFPSYASFDEFGSFHLYDVEGAIYHTLFDRTPGKCEGNNLMMLRPDGNLVLFDANKKISNDTVPLFECRELGCTVLEYKDCELNQCLNSLR